MSKHANEPSSQQVGKEPVVIVDVRSLFKGQREIALEHEGVRYRLRITRRGKLILQK